MYFSINHLDKNVGIGFMYKDASFVILVRFNGMSSKMVCPQNIVLSVITLISAVTFKQVRHIFPH